MIGISQNKEDVLQNSNKERLKKHAGGLSIRIFGHVIQEFNAHCESSTLDFAIIVFAGPHAGVNDKLELPPVQLEECRKAVEIDGFQKLEKFNTVIRILGEVLVDHFKGALEYVLHYGWYFVLHEVLLLISSRLYGVKKTVLTEYLDL